MTASKLREIARNTQTNLSRFADRQIKDIDFSTVVAALYSAAKEIARLKERIRELEGDTGWGFQEED